MPSVTSDPASFDIYNEYLALRRQTLPPALAAVAALGTSLKHHPVQTISETLDLLSSLSESLKTHITNPSIIAAGTDTFQRYLVTALARPTHGNRASTQDGLDDGISLSNDFQVTKAAIVKAADQYVKRGLKARERTWNIGRRFLQHGTTVVVSHPSDAVAGFLKNAASAGVRFCALLVRPSHRRFLAASDDTAADDSTSYSSLVSALAQSEVPCAIIEPAELAHAVTTLSAPTADDTTFSLPGAASASHTVILSGAAALLSTGGVLAEVGTQQAACVAKTLGLDFWVIAEGYKVVRWDALSGTADAGLRSIAFDAGRQDSEVKEAQDSRKTAVDEDAQGLWELGRMDITPANLLSGIVTELGPQTPAAVAEEAIRIWF